MLSTETLEVVRHHTSIWAVTTRIAVVDAVVSAPVALPLSTEYCDITHRIDTKFCAGDSVVLIILFVGFFSGLIMIMAICFVMSERNVKDLIDWLKSRAKEEWEEIVDSRAKALGNWTECPPYKVHRSKKKKRSLLSICMLSIL